MSQNYLIAFSVLALTALTGCAGATSSTEVSDPFESYNRAIFAFNDAVDETVLVPVTKGYRAVVPQPVRTGVHNVLTNLKSPVTIGNQILQGDVEGAGISTVRTVVNTIIGLGGLIDVASMEGIEDESEDFGQTLAVWGVGHGPYMVVPLLPPASLRDHVGSMADTYVDPLNRWLLNTDREGWFYARMGVGVLDTRDQLLDVLADLKKNSIDYYASVRSTYAQRRAALVADEASGSTWSGGAADIPNYDAGEE